MATPELWLTGKQLNLKMDRDTAFSLSVLSTGDEILSGPVFEIERSRSEGRLTIPPALIPVPTIGLSNKRATAAFTMAMTGGLNDLAPDGRLIFVRYRFRCQADGGNLRTYLGGIMAIGPVGYAESSDNLELPFQIATGDIVVGNTATDPGDPPPDGEDTLFFTTMWESDFAEAWEDDVFTTWEVQP